jgi:hypothetical protein
MKPTIPHDVFLARLLLTCRTTTTHNLDIPSHNICRSSHHELFRRSTHPSINSPSVTSRRTSLSDSIPVESRILEDRTRRGKDEGAKSNVCLLWNDKREIKKRLKYISVVGSKLIVYYESVKRELKMKLIYECRCDERLRTKTNKFTRLSYTG